MREGADIGNVEVEASGFGREARMPAKGDATAERTGVGGSASGDLRRFREVARQKPSTIGLVGHITEAPNSGRA